jgi:hypothetical protein
MKHLRKFNESNSSEINEDSIRDIFKSYYVQVSTTLEDLLSDTTILIKNSVGEIYEYSNGDISMKWESDDVFKQKTGASLDIEYSLNKSDKLLELISDQIDDYRISDIESIYFEGDISPMLLKLFFKRKKKSK